MISEKKLNSRFLIYKLKQEDYAIVYYIDKWPDTEGACVSAAGNLVDLEDCFSWETIISVGKSHFYHKGYVTCGRGFIEFPTIIDLLLSEEIAAAQRITFDYMRIVGVPVKYAELRELLEIKVVK